MPIKPATSDLYIIMTGRPFEGFILAGPFATLSEVKRNANAATQRFGYSESWLLPVQPRPRDNAPARSAAKWWRELARTAGAYVRVMGPVLGPWEFTLADKAGPRSVRLQSLEEHKLTLDAPVAA